MYYAILALSPVRFGCWVVSRWEFPWCCSCAQTMLYISVFLSLSAVEISHVWAFVQYLITHMQDWLGQVWSTVKYAVFNAVNSSQHVGISLMLFLHSVSVLHFCMPVVFSDVKVQMWAFVHYTCTMPIKFGWL